MPPVIRKPVDSERDAVRQMWQESFPESGECFLDWYFASVYRSQCTFGLFEGDTLVSNLQMIPYTIQLRGRPVPVEALSGVATGLPWRKQGHARVLMAHSLADMASRGLGFNFLYPFNHVFYQRLGWETCSLSLEYRRPAPELPDPPPGWVVSPADQPDFAVLSALYAGFMGGRNCFCLRDDAQWRRRVQENHANGGFVLLACLGGEPLAYAFCEEREDEVEIVELVHACPMAVEAVLVALKPFGKTVWWTAPVDDRIHLLGGVWKDRVRLQPHVMLRVVDVPLALAQATPACAGEFVIEVTGDTMVPGNNGKYCVLSQGGSAHAWRIDAPPQFACGIGTLARILTGYLDAGEALRAGLAQGNDKTAELLCRMYPPQRNFMFELY